MTSDHSMLIYWWRIYLLYNYPDLDDVITIFPSAKGGKGFGRVSLLVYYILSVWKQEYLQSNS